MYVCRYVCMFVRMYACLCLYMQAGAYGRAKLKVCGHASHLPGPLKAVDGDLVKQLEHQAGADLLRDTCVCLSLADDGARCGCSRKCSGLTHEATGTLFLRMVAFKAELAENAEGDEVRNA